MTEPIEYTFATKTNKTFEIWLNRNLPGLSGTSRRLSGIFMTTLKWRTSFCRLHCWGVWTACWMSIGMISSRSWKALWMLIRRGRRISARWSLRASWDGITCRSSILLGCPWRNSWRIRQVSRRISRPISKGLPTMWRISCQTLCTRTVRLRTLRRFTGAWRRATSYTLLCRPLSSRQTLIRRRWAMPRWVPYLRL